MTIDILLACLRAIPRPAEAEEWLLTNPTVVPRGTVPADYRRAVQDMLVAMGVISAETGEVTSPIAYYFVQSLLASLRDGALTPAAWQGAASDDRAGIGARLVRLLETHRASSLKNPAPLRVIQAVMAVIKARRGTEDVYLMQYDKRAEQFQPIGGKQENFDADSEAALTRELCEELEIEGLQPGRDFELRPVVDHVHSMEVSPTVYLITQYDHSFYHVTNIRFPVPTDQYTRWISAAELADGRTHDGLAISGLLDEHVRNAMATLEYSLPHPVG